MWHNLKRLELRRVTIPPNLTHLLNGPIRPTLIAEDNQTMHPVCVGAESVCEVVSMSDLERVLTISTDKTGREVSIK